MVGASTMAAMALGASAIGTGMGAVSAFSQAKQQQKAAEFQAKQAENNARVAEMNAEIERENASRAERAGHEQAQAIRRQAAQVIGAQRAVSGASGLDADSGSLLEVQADTAERAEFDALTAMQRGFDQAYAYRLNALNQENRQTAEQANARMYASQASAAGNNAVWSAGGTALAGLTSLANQGSAWDKQLKGKWK